MNCSQSAKNDPDAASGAPPGTAWAGEAICLSCGLCCKGVIFADVRLQPPDDAGRLAAAGLPLRHAGGRRESAPGTQGGLSMPGRRVKFLQPCAAFDGCCCAVYDSRPGHCRHFECGVLKGLKGGRVQSGAATRLIRLARAKAEKVGRLLRQLGDTDETLALAKRFRRTTRRLEEGRLEPAMAELYGELTVAVHDLNLLLSEAFYPGHRAHEV